MISWHKPGQKITPKSEVWFAFDPADQAHAPVFGEVYTIKEVVLAHGIIWFRLDERPSEHKYSASGFAPVYPQQIEELRRLCQNPHDEKAALQDA